MLVSASTLALIALVGVAIYVVIANRQTTPKGTNPLPGPPGLPLIGNLHQIPPYHSWLVFKQWADQYGPILKINLGGVDHILVSTEKIANDLMRARGTQYSDRPQPSMAAKLLNRNLHPLFLPYGETWRAERKFIHSVGMPAAATRYEPIQEEEALRVVFNMLKDPLSYERHFESFSASLIMRINFGITIYTGKEDVLKAIKKANHELERCASPGAYLVDTFPILMYLPKWLAPFKREGDRLFEERDTLYRSLVDGVGARAAAGDPAIENTMTKQWLDNKEKYQPAVSGGHAYHLLGTLFEAAAATTSAAMACFLHVMVLHPNKYQKLKTEMDAVVPADRLPGFADLPQLPYLRACVKETLRLRPVVAGGLPHAIIAQDDVYEGFHIKKGSVIHPVQWNIHREEALYPKPEDFIPERWLESRYPTYKEPLTEYPTMTQYSCFGFGRRICPGLEIAQRSLFIQAAVLAWGCNIRAKRSKDLDGREEVEMPPTYDYTKGGFNALPEYFDYELEVRSQEKEALVQSRFAQVWAEKIRQNGGDANLAGQVGA